MVKNIYFSLPHGRSMLPCSVALGFGQWNRDIAMPLRSKSLPCNCLVGLDLPALLLCLRKGHFPQRSCSSSLDPQIRGCMEYSQEVTVKSQLPICDTMQKWMSVESCWNLGALCYSAKLSNTVWVILLLMGKRQWGWFWTKYRKVFPSGSFGTSWSLGETVGLNWDSK